jgi:AcrR family transcriptional regulator
MNTDSDTVSKILQSAREIFAEFGFEGARIDEIAKRAGVNKAMIYYHFKSKEELYQKILDSFFITDPLIIDQIDKETHSYWEKLTRCIYSISNRVEKNKKERCSIIAREMVSHGNMFRMIRDTYWIPEYKKIKSIIQQGIDVGEFKTPSQPIDLIVFTIFSHVIYYRINEVAYMDSEIYQDLYPPDNEKTFLNYLFHLLQFLLLK